MSEDKKQATGLVLEVGSGAHSDQNYVTLNCTREEAIAWAALLYTRVTVTAEENRT